MARNSVALGATNDSVHADVYTPKFTGRRNERIEAPVAHPVTPVVTAPVEVAPAKKAAKK